MELDRNGGEEGILRQRLIWLTQIRRCAAIGMILASLAGRYVFGVHIPIHLLAVLAALTLLYNHYYVRQIEKPVLNRRIAFQQIHLDVILLTLTLLITGGFLNPFFTFYFFAVILAWIVLSVRESVVVTLMVTAGFSLQSFASKVNRVDLHLTNEGLLKLGELPFHVVGAPISFVVTTALTAYFVSVIMRDLRKREREVLAARRQTELELSKLDNILRHMEAGMLVVGIGQRIEWANDRLLAWFGSEGMDESCACYRIGRYAKQFHRETPDRPTAESARYFETQLPTLADGVRHFEIVVHPISDARGERAQIVEIVLDVTEQKKKNEQWAQAQKLAAVGQLAAGMAHEINTPLGSISILAQEAREIVRENARQCDCLHGAEIEESLRTIYEQTLRCKQTTQSLLDVSRAPTQTREICLINDLVRRAVEFIRPRASRVEFLEELDDSLPPTVSVVSEIERALFNLLLNAVDALESRRDSPRIRIQTRQENGTIVIRVLDNGAGVRSEDMPRIFEPFFTTKTVGKGTGLGLYVSYNAIRDVGGRLEIESEPGAGTKAAIWLPINPE
jgi:C4-dicarboxylate-specific signal transduction histidine kinase